MFFDLNVPVPSPSSGATSGQSQHQFKKNKGKQSVGPAQQVFFSAAQMAKIENRLDLLVRLGYTVVAFTQTVQTKIDPRNHVNTLDPLLGQLRKRPGVVFLKRLTIILDEDSEKGFGLTNANASLFVPYDLLALQPTTQTSFSLACLSHTIPSPLTAHIITPPLTLPRLPFRMKHTLVRTALKNGAVFEIAYAGVLQGEGERRNWWAAAREVARVTKGKGLLVSGGVENDVELRAPRDIGNLITLLDIAQDLAHNASTTTPKSLVLRAQTRKTYRAVLSEPTLILASAVGVPSFPTPPSAPTPADNSATPQPQEHNAVMQVTAVELPQSHNAQEACASGDASIAVNGKKRGLDDGVAEQEGGAASVAKSIESDGNKKKRRKRKEKGEKEG